LVTPVAWLLAAFGATDPVLFVRAASMPFIGLATLNCYLVHRIAQRAAGPRVGVVAAAIYAFHWLPLGFGATVYPRTVSTTCVLLAFLLLQRRDRDLSRGLAAGGVVAAAFAVRYSEVIYLLPLCLMGWALRLGTQKSLIRAAGLVGGFLVGGSIFVGLVDLWTWGRPFSSLVEFAQYTLVEKSASSLRPDQPALWYLKRAQFWLIPTLLPFLFVKKQTEQAAAFWLMFVLPIVALSLVHHKELRYLQGVIPFLAVLAALGVFRLWDRGWRKTSLALLIVSSLFSGRMALELHREKSLSAVRTALDFAQAPDGQRVIVTQAWAYGDRLFFHPHVELVNFETPPSAQQLRKALSNADAAGFYEEDLRRLDDLSSVLQEAGFKRGRLYKVGSSRPVVMFRKG
jgi:hypothetical protein